MTSTRTIVLLIAVAAMTAGCSSKSNRTGGGGPTQQPPPPPPASYALTVASVDVVNKDTGEAIVVGGLPSTGGELRIQ